MVPGSESLTFIAQQFHHRFYPYERTVTRIRVGVPEFDL